MSKNQLFTHFALSLFLTFFASQIAHASVIFGAESFNSENGDLKTVVRTLSLGDNQPGAYLLKLQNGASGPALMQQCVNKASVELKRQCQYENLVERLENQFTRVHSFNITVNGKKISATSLLNKSTSYLEFPIILNLPINEIKFSVQGNPEAFAEAKIEELTASQLPPSALFSLNSNYGRAPYNLKFNASQSFDPLNKALTYQWFVNDQLIASTKTGTYALQTPGTAVLKLIVTNSDGLASELSADIVTLNPAVQAVNKRPIPKITVSYPDPLNLRLIKVSALDSVDPDGFITKTVINFGDGTTVVNSNESLHQYSADGTFLIRVTVTDDLGSNAAIEKSVAISQNSELSKVSSLFGPISYYGSFSAYNDYLQTLNVNRDETSDLYKIRIKNADGKEHPIKTCVGTTAEKIMCNYNNLISRAYIALYRVDYANIYVGNKKITDSLSINKSKKSFETYLKLSEINQLKIRLKGWPTAYVQVEVERLGIVSDATAPILSSNVESNTMVRSNLVHVAIEDNSNAITAVYKDGVLQSNQTIKEFDLTLTEGANNFVLKSKDAVDNRASDFVLSNIVLDSVAPVASAVDLKTKYIFTTLPQTITLDFSGNEDLSSAVVNGEALTRVNARQFRYEIKIFDEVKTTLQLKLKDLVGNESTTNYSFLTELDVTAPVLSIHTVLPALTKVSQLAANFRIVEKNDVTTTVKVNGVIVGTSTAKSFNQVLPLNRDGINSIEAVSVDGMGHVSNVATAQITKDTVGPVLSTLPLSGAIVPALTLNITGTSNEPLSQVLINSKAATLSSDKLSFSYSFVSTTYGVKNLTFLAKDILGNASSKIVQYTLQSSTIPFVNTNILNGSFTSNPNVQITAGGDNLNNLTVSLDDEILFNANQTSYSFVISNEGVHKLDVSAKNAAGKVTSQTYNFTFDQTAPFINLYGMQAYTTQDSINLDYNFYDLSPSTLRVFVDQNKIYETTDVQGNFEVPLLTEGTHLISVGAIDAAGNISEIISFEATKDTSAPRITVISPNNNEYVDGTTFKVKVTVDDVVTSIRANSVDMVWNETESLWESTFTSNNTEDYQINIVATNALGLIGESVLTVKPLLKSLEPTLLGLYEDAINQKIVVKGAEGSTRPFLQVNIKSGIFSSTTIQADNKGSFMATLDPKDQYVISVTDPITNEVKSHTLQRFNQEVILSGIIKDNNNQPINGVLISLGASNIQTYSNESGVFTFNASDFPDERLSGSQVLTVDGSGLNRYINDRYAKFSKTILNVNLSHRQNNIIQSTIYLYPTYLENNDPIHVSSGGVATSPDAPGVELSIPASAANFPSGADAESISIFTVDADRVTIAPPSEALASKVVILEPSGTTFSEPVELTIPNFSNFPPKTNLIIMLFNSKTGRWEPGGAAIVSENGESVTTKEDQGIRHFSMAFAMPPPPDIMTTNLPDKPGADSFSGAATNQISTPEFKVLGQKMSASLIYKSAWAKPSTTVTNIFNIPDKKIFMNPYVESGTQLVNYQVDFVNCTSGGLFGADFNKFLGNASRFLDPAGFDRAKQNAERDLATAGVYPSNCSADPHTFYNNIDYKNSYSDLAAVITPQKVEMNFLTADIKPPVKTFKNIPRMAQLSQFVELKNEQNQYLATGLYPYVAHYKVFYDQLITGTVKSEYYSELTGAVNEQPKALTPIVSNSTFGADLIDNLFVQNYKNSAAGQGWKIGGVQKIINPNAQKIMIEEADGSIATYAVKNSITTVADLSALGGDLTKGIGLNMWPSFAYSESIGENDDPNRKIYRADLNQGTYQKTEIGRQQNIVGRMFGYTYYNWTMQGQQLVDRVCTHHIPILNICDVWEDRISYEQLPRSTCHTNKYDFKIGAAPSSILLTNSGAYVLDSARSSLGYVSTAGYVKQLGTMTQPEVVYGFTVPVPNNPYALQVTYDTTRMATFKDSTPEMIYTTTEGRRDTFPQHNACGRPFDVLDRNGEIPQKGDLNTALNMISSPNDPNILIIADTGNNRVISYNITSHETQIIAGGINGNDDGDGGPANQASFNQPQGLVFDAAGNLYVSTKMGHIRKISTDGIVSTVAGDALNGLYLAEGDAVQMQFNEPYGLAFDNQSNSLYVADSGNNRIVKIDLFTNTAVTVAGNGQSGFSGDGGSAVDASLSRPTHIAIYSGSLIIADSGNNRIRQVQLNNTGAGLADLNFEPSTKDHSRLVKKTDGSWERIARNGQIEYFSSLGFHLKSKSPNLIETNYSYENGSLKKVTFSSGQELNYNYSGNRLSTIVDPAGRATQFTYNGLGQLSRVTYPDNTQRQFDYSITGLLVEELNAKGLSTTYLYNQYDRLEKVTLTGNTHISVGDSKSPGLVEVDSSGVYTPKSIGLSQDQASESITDANGNKVKLVKDVDGYISTIVDPRGRTQKIQRDLDGRVTELTDVDGSVVRNTYDSAYGDLIKTENISLDIVNQKTYNQYGQILTETDSYGKVASNEYNNKRQIVKQIAPDGKYIVYGYNNSGLISNKTGYSSLGAAQSSTTYEYDVLGRLIKQTDLSGKYSTYTYDGAGNVLTATSNISSGNLAITVYEYDVFNRLVKVTTPKNEVTEYTYSHAGELLEIKDPHNKVTEFEYDLKGHLTKKTDPNGYITSFTYDNNGNRLTETDPNNQTKVFSYNSINKVTQVQTSDDLILYAYNLKDEVISLSNSSSSIEYIRDAKQRVTQESVSGVGISYPAHVINNTFAKNDLRTSIASTYQSLAYGYNTNNYQLISIQSNLGPSFSFSYDDGNRLDQVSRPGSITNFTYGESGTTLSSIVHSSGGTIKSSFEYQYDLRNYITQKRSLASTLDYSYDSTGQLTNIQNAQNSADNESFSYDAVGNRITYNSVSSSYDSTKQRIQDDGQYTYLYDYNGNVTYKGSKAGGASYQFDYSALNQLKKATVVSAPLNGTTLKTIEYKYDPLGRRISRQVIDIVESNKSNTKKYYYDSSNIVAELDGQNNLTATYVYSPLSPDDIMSAKFTAFAVSAIAGGTALSEGQVLSASQGSVYYLKDHINTVTDIIDGNGNIIQRYDYYSFGEIKSVRNGSGVSVDFNQAPVRTSYTFTGREYEPETKMYYYRARYMDPATGRFLQQDSDPGKISLPKTVNSKYIYTINNPIIFTDSTGMDFLADAKRAFVVVGAIYLGALAAGATIAFFGLTGVWAVLGGLLAGAVVGGAFGAIAYPALGIGTPIEGFQVGSIAGAIGGLAEAVGLTHFSNFDTGGFHNMWNTDTITSAVKGIGQVKYLPNTMYNSISLSGLSGFMATTEVFFSVLIPVAGSGYLLNEISNCANGIKCSIPSLDYGSDF